MSAPADWIPFVNTEEEAIPAGAVVEPAGGFDGLGRMRVRKCTRDNSLLVFFNSPHPVAAADTGYPDEENPGGACRPPWPATAAAVNPADVAGYATDTAAGTEADSWYLLTGNTGFQWIGDLVDGIAFAIPTAEGSGGGGGGGAAILTGNTTSTPSGSTSSGISTETLNANTTSGLRMQGNATSRQISGLAATTTQQGMVSLTYQSFIGTKTIQAFPHLVYGDYASLIETMPGPNVTGQTSVTTLLRLNGGSDNTHDVMYICDAGYGGGPKSVVRINRSYGGTFFNVYGSNNPNTNSVDSPGVYGVGNSQGQTGGGSPLSGTTLTLPTWIGGIVTGTTTVSLPGGGITSITSSTPTTLTGYITGNGSTLNAVAAIPWADISSTPTTLAGYGITDAQPEDDDLTALAALGGTGIAVRTAADTWATREIEGTTDRIEVVDGDGVSGNPTIDIAATYEGQSSINTLGTIATGTWEADTIAAEFGGTGISVYAVGDMLYADTTTTLATLATTSFGRGFNALGDAAAARTYIGAGTGTGTVTSITLTQPAAGITITDSGVALTTSGTRTLALANDLAAVEGLATTGIVRRTGTDAWSAGTLVTLAEQADLAGLSVPGRSANSTGVMAALTAGTDGHVLRRSGTTLGFGTVVTAGIADDAVTTAKIANAQVTLAKQANFAASSLQGNPTGSPAVPSAITLGPGLEFSGTTVRAIASASGNFQSAAMSANQPISTTGLVDVTGLSLSLAAGTWDVHYSVGLSFGFTSGTFCFGVAVLDSGGSTVANSLMRAGLRDDIGFVAVTVSRTIRLVLASTTTVKVRVEFGGASPIWTVRNVLGDNSGGSSILTATRVA